MFAYHFAALLLLLGAVTVAATDFVVPPVFLEPAPYADWAHSHWVWLSADVANQSNAEQLVSDYFNHQIRVGGYDIDSGWATGYTTFEWNTKKYPNSQEMIDFFHNNGVRVILWATSTINVDTPLFNYTSDRGWLLKRLLTNETLILHYWHGDAGYIDYNNPDALAYYHSLMDNQLNQGVDGWKNDGTDPFLLEAMLEGGIRSHTGVITEREYADLYYRDFFYYSRQKNGNVTLCMNRPYDSFKNYVYFKFAPRDTVFSGWVGDEDPTFDGLVDALKNMIVSGANNYVSFGCDIGGYRHGNRTREVLLRWAQLGSLVGLMENGGDGEHRPWMFDNFTQTVYKTFVDLHYEIKPYLITTGAQAYESGVSIMRPFTNQLVDIVDFDYMLGEDIFVSPIISNATVHTVHFPKMKNDSWVWYFDPTQVFKGGETVKDFPMPLSVYPVFKRAGSIIPVSLYPSAIAPNIFAWHNDEIPILGAEIVWPQLMEVFIVKKTEIRSGIDSLSPFSQGMMVTCERTSIHELMIQVSSSPQPFILKISGLMSSISPSAMAILSFSLGEETLPLESDLSNIIFSNSLHFDGVTGVVHISLLNVGNGARVKFNF